jgi:hypothetical protein
VIRDLVELCLLEEEEKKGEKGGETHKQTEMDVCVCVCS